MDPVATVGLGFRPAFLDFATCAIYLSDSIDTLPDEVVLRQPITGWVSGTKPTLVAGFERKGFFYTRASAERAAAEWQAGK